MNIDLSNELYAAGGDFDAVVESLRSVPSYGTSAGFTECTLAALGRERAREAVLRARWSFAKRFSIAAALAVFLSVGAVYFSASSNEMASLVAAQRADGTFSASSAAAYVQAYAVAALAGDKKCDTSVAKAAVEALLRTQNADGGWGNAALTLRNVAALAEVSAKGDKAALSALKKGRRYLSVHGLSEISRGDLVADARNVLKRLGADSSLSVPVSALLARN